MIRQLAAITVWLAIVTAAMPVFAQRLSGNDADGPAPAPTTASAAVSREELDVVATELARLRAEVASLRGELASVRGVIAVATPGPSTTTGLTATPSVLTSATASDSAVVTGTQPEQAAPSVEMLRTQMDEMSQTKVESRSRMPVRLFGAIVSNTVGNSGAANWLENPNITDPEPPGTTPGSFTSTLRQSQIGLNVGPIPVGGLTVNGAVVADFMGGVPGFVTGTVMGLPRMVYAFARLESERTALQVGQDLNLLAPRDPTSLAAQSFPLLFRSGNLYLRSPQVRLEQKLGAGITLKGGIAAPLAADAINFYTFAPAAGAGERSQRPAFEGRADYTAGDPDAAGEFTVGVSGRYGWRKPLTEVQSTGSYAVDFNARIGRIGTAGEFFYTDDAAEFGGGVAQARPAKGGWVEARLGLTSKISTNVGVGLDQVRDTVPLGARHENKSAFGNVIFDLTPEVAVSMEYRWLETQLGNALVKRDNHHVNAAFVVRF
jgi:hypothetical protein